MTKATIPTVNAALTKAGIPLELVRGDGYHYFIYDVPSWNCFETVSVYIPYTSHQTIERWVEEGRWAIEAIRIELTKRGAIKAAVKEALA